MILIYYTYILYERKAMKLITASTKEYFAELSNFFLMVLKGFGDPTTNYVTLICVCGVVILFRILEDVGNNKIY